MIMLGVLLITMIIVVLVIFSYIFWKFFKDEVKLMFKEVLFLKSINEGLKSINKLFTKKDKVDVKDLLTNLKKEKDNGRID